MGGPWSPLEKKLHINALELKAANIAVRSMTKNRENVHIHLKMDNVTAVTYVNKMGGTKSPILTSIAKDLWEYCLGKKITDSRTPSWNSQPDSRLGKQECVQYKYKQLETEPQNICSNKSTMGSFGNRFVCRQTEWTTGEIHELETRPNCCGYRCTPSKLGRDESLCISTILSHTEMHSESPERERGVGHCDTSMADTAILPHVVEHVNSKPNPSTTTDEPSFVSRGENTPSGSQRNTEVSGLENFRRNKEMQGLSTNTSELLAASWRKGTQSAYNSCWRHWASWCNSRQTNPFLSSLEHIANFLSDLFQKGYEYRSVNCYRSAISAFHPEINGIRVGQSNLVKQVMAGVFNSRPPMPDTLKHGMLIL
jgi:hypothetical protein